MLSKLYEVAPIGAGMLSVMAKPVPGEFIDEEFAGLRSLGVDRIVCLLERAEQIDVGLSAEPKLCERYGMRYTHFPIVDRSLPDKCAALELVARLYRDIEAGEHVAVHCRAGIGRTGCIACAVLVRDGYSPARAIHTVSASRGILVPDTVEQDRWIRSLECGNR